VDSFGCVVSGVGVVVLLLSSSAGKGGKLAVLLLLLLMILVVLVWPKPAGIEGLISMFETNQSTPRNASSVVRRTR